MPITQEDLAKLGPNHLTQEIAERVAKAPQRWTMVVTVADPGDPTADPSIAWPPGRRAVEVGTLVVQRIEGEQEYLPVPRHQFRPDDPAQRRPGVGRSIPRGAIRRLCGVL